MGLDGIVLRQTILDPEELRESDVLYETGETVGDMRKWRFADEYQELLGLSGVYFTETRDGLVAQDWAALPWVVGEERQTHNEQYVHGACLQIPEEELEYSPMSIVVNGYAESPEELVNDSLDAYTLRRGGSDASLGEIALDKPRRRD